MKIFFQSSCIGILFMLCISLCIYYAPLEVEDFTPNKAAVGVYKYTPGAYKVSARAEIVSLDGTSYDAACEVGIFGSSYPCAEKELSGKSVYIEYARYPKFWWHGDFIMSMIVEGKNLRNYRRADVIKIWLKNSYTTAAKISASIAILFLVLLYGIDCKRSNFKK